MIRLLAALLVCPALLAAPEASADSFYLCKKKGHAPAMVNQPIVAAKRKQGWRCRKRMQFGDSSPRPRSRTSRPSTSSNTGGSGPSTVWAPRRFAGPAGEAETYEPYIQEAASRYNVPANLVRAVIRVESNFRPQAVSSAGAKGLMQLMPGTAKEMAVTDIFDPRQNILGGTRYIRLVINQFKGDARLAIAAYHAGPGAVARKGDIPYEATRRYVKSVLTHYFRYKDAQL